MKKLTSLLIGCSLALAGAALAQQPAEQQSPSKGKRAPEKTHATEPQPRANPAKPQERPNQTGAIKQRNAINERSATGEHGAANAPGMEKGRKTRSSHEAPTAETNAPGQATGGATNEPSTGKNRKARAHDESAKPAKPNEKQQAEQQRKDVNEPAAAAKTSGSPAAGGTHSAPPAPGAGQQNAQVRGMGKAKKPAPQQVQQVKSQHYRIEGSDHWQGQQYQVFRSYQPQWHDQGWYQSHYPRVELIGGGYYYFNNGYWFPAWGYSPSAQYYAYDGPIYVGQHAEPPDRVIADTQALLQQMGYYTGEVDGLLGPLTRQALAAYQADNGLTQTASIDEPTLDSLGLS
jgi:hypothetical protein